MKTKVESKQLAYLMQQTRTGVAGQVLLLCLMYALIIGTEFPVWLLTIIFSLGLLLQFLRFANYKKYLQHSGDDNQVWVRRYVIDVFWSSVVWALLFIGMFYYLPIEYHYIAMAVGLGISGAAIVTLGALFKVYLAFSTPILLSLVVALIYQQEYTQVISGFVTLLGWVYLVLTASKYSKLYADMLENNLLVQASNKEALELLGRAGEYRDEDTGNHVDRVAKSVYLVAKALGKNDDWAHLISDASRLHDIGKIGISDSILLKPGKLTDEERKVMESHTELGVNVLDMAESTVFRVARIIAESHHERWDGKGYPSGTSKNDIPVESRIVSICDVFDALTSTRPYK